MRNFLIGAILVLLVVFGIRYCENRNNEKDQLEEKRKLKNTNYNILADLNPEELEKYKERKLEWKKEKNITTKS